MEYRLFTAALVLGLTGCFSDPPSASPDESSTGGSTTEPGSTSEDPGSSGAAESSNGGGTSDITEDEFICNDGPTVPVPVPADVVVLVDLQAPTQSDLIDAIFSEFAMDSNVAVLLPEGLDVPFDPDCSSGCQSCGAGMMGSRVVLRYEDDPLAALLRVEEYACIFRGPPMGGVVASAPVRNLWIVTDDPPAIIPEPVADAIGSLEARVHVACPMCTPNSIGAVPILAQATGGSVSNLLMPGDVEDQADVMTRPRHSCVWTTDAVPDLVGVTVPGVLDVPLFVVEGESSCAEELEGKDPYGAFYPIDIDGESAVQLCDGACAISQLAPAQNTELLACFVE